MKGRIDIDKMKEYTSANDVLVKKLLQSFINNIPGQLDQLQQSLKDNDLPLVRDMAHKLKTPFMYVGVEDVANKLAAIEQNYQEMAKDNLEQEIIAIVTQGNVCVEEAKEMIAK